MQRVYGKSFDTSQLGQVVFKDMYYLDVLGGKNFANGTVMSAYEHGNPAITLGNTVYVNPNRWNSVVSPNGATFWEEISHTLQYRENTLSILQYGMAVGMAWAAGLDGHDNHIELQAADLMAPKLLNNWKSGNGC